MYSDVCDFDVIAFYFIIGDTFHKHIISYNIDNIGT